jgi:hypothetical protein
MGHPADDGEATDADDPPMMLTPKVTEIKRGSAHKR